MNKQVVANILGNKYMKQDEQRWPVSCVEEGASFEKVPLIIFHGAIDFSGPSPRGRVRRFRNSQCQVPNKG